MQMPYSCACVEMLLMYVNGSRHSSSVGKYVGASVMPLGRLFGWFVGSRYSVGCPLRSTEVRSRAALDKELKGTLVLAGLKPFAGGFPFVLDDDGPDKLPTAGELRALALALPLRPAVGVALRPEAGPMVMGGRRSKEVAIAKYLAAEADHPIAGRSGRKQSLCSLGRTIGVGTIAWSWSIAGLSSIRGWKSRGLATNT